MVNFAHTKLGNFNGLHHHQGSSIKGPELFIKEIFLHSGSGGWGCPELYGISGDLQLDGGDTEAACNQEGDGEDGEGELDHQGAPPAEEGVDAVVDQVHAGRTRTVGGGGNQPGSRQEKNTRSQEDEDHDKPQAVHACDLPVVDGCFVLEDRRVELAGVQAVNTGAAHTVAGSDLLAGQNLSRVVNMAVLALLLLLLAVGVADLER